MEEQPHLLMTQDMYFFRQDTAKTAGTKVCKPVQCSCSVIMYQSVNGADVSCSLKWFAYVAVSVSSDRK